MGFKDWFKIDKPANEAEQREQDALAAGLIVGMPVGSSLDLDGGCDSNDGSGGDAGDSGGADVG